MDAKVRTTAASTFRLDIKGAEVRQALAAVGIRTVLLKGPAFTRLLYPVARSRGYSDVDLLVSPADLARSEQTLVAAEFRPFEREALARQTDEMVGQMVGVHGASQAKAWLRERDHFVVDLHDSLPQCGAPAGVVWETVTQHLEVLMLGGVPTETLDGPATALLVSLHAAHHGPDWGPAGADLQAALDVFDMTCWERARVLAVALKAESAMGVGLGTSEAGRATAAQLSLRTEPTGAHRLRGPARRGVPACSNR